MKICYLISATGPGRGGHFYSCKATAESLSQKVECIIISIGTFDCPVIDSANVKTCNVRFTGLNLLGAVRELSRIVRREKVDIFHAFDTPTYFFGRLMSLLFRKPIILTKCGGPNPVRYFPYADYLIVYSTENEGFFKKERKFTTTRIYLIPNRISRFKSDFTRIDSIRSRLDSKSKIFLRISRFSPAYKESTIQCVNLINRLNEDGHTCQLVLIGVIERKEVFDEIAQLQSEKIKIFCGDEYTIHSSELIDIADFVIGTGRGFMEAASKGKILLTPLMNSKYPLLVTEQNFGKVFATNFSPRNQIDNYNEEENYKAIVRVLCDESLMANMKEQSKLFFDKFFSVDAVVDKYCDIYRTATYNKNIRLFDLVLHMYTCLKTFISITHRRSLSRFRSQR
ncbi:MAG: glycosyltransferase family 4 protein [Desulfobacteraceae bacterium]|nr:glycosyltransferase family 4 protein [Desulfobacteraceae bacterium]